MDKILNTMWLVTWVDEIGYEWPQGVFHSESEGESFIYHEQIKAKRAHRKVPDYQIDEVYVSPYSRAEIDAENKRLNEEANVRS